jgi:hypothetical protein
LRFQVGETVFYGRCSATYRSLRLAFQLALILYVPEG